MQKMLGVIALAVAFGAATWLGWWAVPLTAALFGALRPRFRRPALVAGFAAALAWAGWLIADAVTGQGALATLSGRLAGIMSLPQVALFALTLGFGALLAWSAAALAGAIAGQIARRSQ